MRAIGICLAITLVTAGLVAQRGPQPDITYRSAADVAALVAKAKAQNDTKAAPTISQPILRLAPYSTNLEYRASVGPASVHLKEAEMFYVIDGSGTLVTGGKLTNEKQQNADNLTGTGIENGHAQAMNKGDFAIVPQGTPHWFSEIKQTLVLMSLHVPRTDNK